MDNIAFITQSTVNLNEIRELAEAMHYKTDLFFEMHERLNAFVGEEASEWWQWIEIEERE